MQKIKKNVSLEPFEVEKPKITDYSPLTVETFAKRMAKIPVVASKLGHDTSTWRVSEVGDGNLNLVFIVKSTLGSLVVKQALPYVRLVGDSWPLPLKRSFFEYHALSRQAARDPGSVPDVYYFDERQAMLVMEYLSPHVILRHSLIAGHEHPYLGEKLGLFLARTLFRGSDLSLVTAERKADLALFAGNVELCEITENLVFTDPYCNANLNRHTSPYLDAMVQRLRSDVDLKVMAQHLKSAFCSNAETLLHGDLHTGSIMVHEGNVRMIDPEFAVYGPMGFDIGMLIANFFMAYFAQSGHETAHDPRNSYRDYILHVIRSIWDDFVKEFSHLWRTERNGILYSSLLFEDQNHHLAAEQALSDRLHGLWCDTLGFAGVEMHRRILGLAHIIEFEKIADPSRRAACEAKALLLGRHLIVNRNQLLSLTEIFATARSIEDGVCT